MDWLLRAIFKSLIRNGNLRVTTARGSTMTLGDGTGPEAAIRFTSPAVERGILIDPELRFGEAYMDGAIVVERGSIADVLSIVLAQTHDGRPPPLGAVAVADALPPSTAKAVQPPPARPAQRCTSLRPGRPPLRAVPRCRPAIQLRLFRGARPVAR